MNTKKSTLLVIAIAFLMLSVTTFCSMFTPAQETEIPETGEIEASATSTLSPSPTLVPTNLVNIQDAGLPLPPKIIAVNPPGGQELGVNGVIRIRFDQPMDQNTTSAALSIFDATGESIDGEVTWMDVDTLLFSPIKSLTSGETYNVTISGEATSIQDLHMEDDYSFDVQVAGNLLVSQVFPGDGAVDVENNAIITVIFNRPVVPLVTVENQDNLVQPLNISPPVSGRGEWLNTSVYVFRPDRAFQSSTVYTGKVEAGLTDTLGSELHDSFEWEFTTVAPSVSSFGIAAPVSVLNPKDNLEDVRPDSSFMVNFHQPMNYSSVTEALSLFSLQGEEVSLDFEWTSDYQVVFTPTIRLAFGTDYNLLLTEYARSASGGNLDEGFQWNFRTIPLPGIESTYPQEGVSQPYFSSRFGINFKSPMNIETIQDRVVVEPEPDEVLTWYYNPWSWSVDFYGLKPSTNYRVRILPGMEDIYGNKIIGEYAFTFRTSDLRPAAYLDLPYAPSIYRLHGPMKFYVSYVNVGTVDVDLYKVEAPYFVGFNNGTYNRWEFVPPNDWWVNSWQWQNTKKLNEITHLGIDLTKASGDALDPGFYFMTINSPQVQTYGTYLDTRLLIVAEANLTFKTTQKEGLMWLTDLDTGEPLSGVSLKVFDNQFEQIGTGATNANGILYLDLPTPEEIYNGRYVMTNDGEPFAYAESNWGSGVSPYEFGIWSDYYNLPDQPVAYVYTDRPLYRPGQSVEFKGIVRQNDDLAYSLLPWENVTVKISSLNDVVYVETLPLSEFGTFDGEFVLDENAMLGFYSIQVLNLIDETSVGGVGFSVAEYRRPEFQVTTRAQSDNVLGGDEMILDIEAEYYSGGGVAGAGVDWAIRAVDYTFQPGGDLRGYTFNDYDRDTDFYYAFGQSPQSEIIATGRSKTDENGNLELSLTADLSERGNSRQFTFEATVTDLAGTSVSDRVDIIAHKASLYAGVRPQRYVGIIGEEQFFDIIVVDWDGQAVPDTKVDVEIVERRWYSVQEQDAQGFITWTSSVKEIPVVSYDGVQVDSSGQAIVSFTPENGGVYKAKVQVSDESGNQTNSGAYMWVSSDDFVSWRQTDDRRIELVVDKDMYQPGDIAEILIASPLNGDNYALVTVERGHIRDQDVILLASNSAVYRLPITADMAPNVYISVIVIQGAEDGGKPDFRMGIVQLNVATEEQEIKVEISPDIEQAGPGDEVTYTIRTTDYKNQPVSAEVSLALADLATLSLTQPNSRPILEYFYDQRSLSVQTAVPIVFSIEHYISTLEDRLTEGEGMGSGGGKGADVYGVFEIRGDFRDTAFWDAYVVTNQDGEAKVTITLPDNLTIWRMDARAISIDTLVGDGENDLRSTKPLLIRPQTPRFFVVGDESRLGAAVHNNTDEDLSVDITLEAAGLSINSIPTKRVAIPAGNQAYITWDVTVDKEATRVDLVFIADGGKYSDASRPPMGTLDNQGIPVYKYEVPETVGTAGVLSEGGSRTEGILIPGEWGISQGELLIEISPSLVAGMADSLEYLEHYPYECVEQTISRFLPNVLTTQALKTAGISDPVMESNLKEQVNIALQRLYNWQRPDGGWGWWPESQESSLLTSSYVVLGLLEAKASGYHVSVDALDRGINYLNANTQTLGKLDRQYLLNRQAFVLYVLAKAGEAQVSLTTSMYEVRQSLSLYARAFLAETLWMIDPGDPRLDTLISDFVNSAILSATGIYWQEEWRDYWNWNTDTRTTAIILATLIQIDPENDLNSNAVRWLMANRTKGHWASTQETAWSLMTLINWMVASGELKADYDWAVGLNGTRLDDGSANIDNLGENQNLEIDIADLFMEEVNRLTFGRDDGPGNLYYTAHMNVYLPVDRIDPLNRGMAISREYFKTSEGGEETPTSSAHQGDLLLTRLTIIVPNDLHYVIIDDPLPAGLEAVDQTLEISPDITAPEGYDFESIWQGGWGGWYFDHIELRDERIVISADYLPAGTYVYTYIVRASTPGEYFVIPPTIHEFYFPEVYGRGAGGKFIVEP